MTTSNTNKLAAFWGNFVNYAYSMYEGDRSNPTPPPPAALTKAGWEVLGWINGVDKVEWLDASSTVTRKLAPVNYGFLAMSTMGPPMLMIALRGTDSLDEWLIDAEMGLVPFSQVPGAGQVEHGFHSVYSTMTFVPNVNGAPGTPRPLRQGLLSVITSPQAAVALAAHSLGSALSSMLLVDLTTGSGALAPTQINAYLLASPKVGNVDFANALVNKVGAQTWHVRYEPDLVPKVPGYPYVTAHVQSIVFPANPAVASSVACNHSLETYLWLLDPHYDLSTQCKCSSDTLAEVAAATAEPV